MLTVKNKLDTFVIGANYNPGTSTLTLELRVTEDQIPNHAFFKFLVEEQVPETLCEFQQMHDLGNDELVDWLNENYTK